VLLLGGGLFVPVPISNVPIAVTIALIAFAYLERDGLLLCAALAATLAVIALAAALTWGGAEHDGLGAEHAVATARARELGAASRRVEPAGAADTRPRAASSRWR
jgi:Exopolysaccharide synthesis, ExoD